MPHCFSRLKVIMNLKLLSFLFIVPYCLGQTVPSFRISTPSSGGIESHFIETGFYGVSTAARGLKLVLGGPACTECRPTGFFSAVDLDSYIGNSPFWVGLHNVGGGFGIHRHNERRNNPGDTVGDSLRHVEVSRQAVLAIIADPMVLTGVAFDGWAGGVDLRLGCAPFSILTGGFVPTMHTKLMVEAYGYSPAVRYKTAHMRVFAGGKAGFLTDGYNAEWGVTVWPAEFAQFMTGVQGGVSIIKFGFAGGLKASAAGRATMNAIYNSRMNEYRLAGGVGDPLIMNEQIFKRFVSSYVAFCWKSLVLGLTNYVELPERQKRVRAKSSFEIALGFTF